MAERLYRTHSDPPNLWTVPKLVVIDTLSRALAGGNENSPDDMGALVGNMDAIRAATGACVLFIHHSGKDEARGMRGHSLLVAAIDTEIEVKANGEDRTATVTKQRDLPKGDKFDFRLEPQVLGINQRGKPMTTCIVAGDNPVPPDAKGPPPWAMKFYSALLRAIRTSPTGEGQTSRKAWKQSCAEDKLIGPDGDTESFRQAILQLKKWKKIEAMEEHFRDLQHGR